ncbi:MAG: metallophosphoesterase [Lachnospiraceae bacterium]|nr:metallophosphoesterase [Lachnospiraceae bacterium]
MKVLIVSDTHRQHGNLEKAIKEAGKIDLLLHLGDVEGGEYFIEQIAGCPVEIISGNNDFFSELDKEKELEIGKYKVLMTHGHYYYVSLGTENILAEGRGRGKDIVMFGHTHRPLIDIHEDITLINPGSISYPRQEGKKPTYITMEIDENGEALFTLHTIE